MAMHTIANCATLDENLYIWEGLYNWLIPQVKRWISASDVVTWAEQVDDLAADIAQEAVTRVFHAVYKAEQGHAPPVASLKGYSLIVARNYFKDLRRKEARLVHFNPSPTPIDDHYTTNLSIILDPNDPIEEVVNILFFKEIVLRLADVIASLPTQQREALLTALAHDLPGLDHQGPLTLLQQALADRGFPLQNYVQGRPTTACMKKRFAANLHAAKQQVAKRFQALP
jgi:DNA-directed RNA polymerase specialized sigma24 family protein